MRREIEASPHYFEMNGQNHSSLVEPNAKWQADASSYKGC
jgi:hypothetical protein